MEFSAKETVLIYSLYISSSEPGQRKRYDLTKTCFHSKPGKRSKDAVDPDSHGGRLAEWMAALGMCWQLIERKSEEGGLSKCQSTEGS